MVFVDHYLILSLKTVTHFAQQQNRTIKIFFEVEGVGEMFFERRVLRRNVANLAIFSGFFESD